MLSASGRRAQHWSTVMRSYKRTPKSKLHSTIKAHAAGHLPERKASILTELHELPQRESLLRLQRSMAGLLKSRQKIARRIARAEREDNQEQVFTLCKLLNRQTTLLQETADRLAATRSEIIREAKPAPKKRNTRNTKAHSKVRKVRVTKRLSEHYANLA